MASDPGRVAAGGEENADGARASTLEALTRRYAPALVRFFERRVSHREDVADLVQDVFLRLARLRDLSMVERPEHYLFTTAASALRDRGRRDAVRHRDAHDEYDELAHGCSHLTPDRVYAGKRAMERLQEAVRELPERTRDVFVLRVFEEYKMADVARALGISQRAAEKHYAKALAHVAAALKDHRDG